MSRASLLIIAAAQILAACSGTGAAEPRPDSEADGAPAGDSRLTDSGQVADAAPWSCPSWQGGVLATIQTTRVTEASGLAASRVNAGIFWTHNDAGDEPEVYGVDAQGQLRAICRLPVEVVDWEDIAIGPGPEPGVDYIYVGDIGDNSAQRRSVVIYRFAEPSVSSNGSPAAVAVTDVAALTLRYPSGGHDAEGLMIDPLTRDVYVTTKAGAGPEEVYVSRGPQDAAQPRDLELVATLTIGSPGLVSAGDSFSGGDISADGDEIALRTDMNAFIWHRPAGASVAAALAAAACSVTLLAEPNGEGIAYDADGVLFTLSEGRFQPIHAYRRQ